MTHERSLTPHRREFPQGFIQKLPDRAFAYLRDNHLPVSQTDLQIAAQLLCETYQWGLGLELARNQKPGRWETTLNLGFELRSKFLTQAERFFRESDMHLNQHKDNSDSFTYFTQLAIPRDIALQAKEEFKQAAKSVTLSKVRAFVQTVETHKIVVQQTAFTIARQFLGLSPEQKIPPEYQTVLLQVDSQARMLRGIVASSLMAVMTKSQGYHSPLFISDEALPDLMKAVTQFGDNTKFTSYFIEMLSARLTQTSTDTDVLPTILTTYLDQIKNTVFNWQRSPARLMPPSRPLYWKRLRDFFAILPLDPVPLAHKYGYTPQDVDSCRKNNLPHLWLHAETFSFGQVPAPQDITLGLKLLIQAQQNVDRDSEDRFRYRKRQSDLQDAMKAWRQYVYLTDQVPLQIAALDAKLKALPTLPPGVPKSTRAELYEFNHVQQQLRMAERTTKKEAEYYRKRQLKRMLDPDVFLAREIAQGIDRDSKQTAREIRILEDQISRPGLLDFPDDISGNQKTWLRLSENEYHKRLTQTMQLLAKLEKGEPLDPVYITQYPRLKELVTYLISATDSAKQKKALRAIADFRHPELLSEFALMRQLMIEEAKSRVHAITALAEARNRMDHLKTLESLVAQNKAVVDARTLSYIQRDIAKLSYMVIPDEARANPQAFAQYAKAAVALDRQFRKSAGHSRISMGSNRTAIPSQIDLLRKDYQKNKKRTSTAIWERNVLYTMIAQQKDNPLIPIEQIGSQSFGVVLTAARFQADVILALIDLAPNSALSNRLRTLTTQADLYRMYQQQVELTEKRRRLVLAHENALPKFADHMKRLNLII